MATYTYEILRRCIVDRLKSENMEIISDNADGWTIWKDDNGVNFLKQSIEASNSWSYPFDFKKLEEFEEFKLLCTEEDSVNKITLNLYFIKLDNGFKINEIDTINNIVVDYIKFENPLYKRDSHRLKNSSTKFMINEYDILSIVPASYICDEHKFITLKNKNISIDTKKLDVCKKTLKTSDYPKIDYTRILDRSFEYFIEYGTSHELDNILCINNGDSKEFSLLREHLESNQAILEENKKNKGNWQPIDRYNKLPDTLRKEVSKFKEHFVKFFKKEVNEGEFKNKFFPTDSQRKCAYCGVPEDELYLLETVRAGRGARLEYDRLLSRDNQNKIAYSLDNIALSCYWCNNAKTDTFSPKEFKPIARGINQVWNQKLKDSGNKDNICFPENSDIWLVDAK